MGETVSDFIFLGSKITADGDCGHEIKRRLLLFFFFFNFFFRGKPDGVGRGGHAEARPRLGSAGPRPPRSPLDFLASSAALSAYFLEEEL